MDWPLFIIKCNSFISILGWKHNVAVLFTFITIWLMVYIMIIWLMAYIYDYWAYGFQI